MRNKLIVLGIVGLTLAAGISSYVGRGWAARAIENGPFVVEIKAEAIALSREDPAQQNIGALTYVAGWALTSESDDFGGWSALALGAGAKSILMLSDKGDWLETTLDIANDSPFGIGRLYPFEKGARAQDKSYYDAESLVRIEGGYLVGFEQEHRILSVEQIGGSNKPAPVNALVDLSVLSSNGGIEAMTKLPNGDLVMFAEHGLDQKHTLPVWIADKKSAETRRFMPPKNYSPTDAAALPNGDMLLLLRHYSQIDGVSAKVLLLSAEALNGSETLVGRELAHLADPLSVDNMEALDIEVLPDGSVRLYMMSDDNFNPLQRTLFLVFDWMPED